jgi:hypothetical protein
MGLKKWGLAALGGLGGFLVGGPMGAAQGASMGMAAGEGDDQNRRSEQYANRALQQSEREYNERAPLRRQGMQALGQIEAPINLGNIGFNPSNPFAAARGPAPSTATLGGWDRMTTPPEQMEQAMAQPSPLDRYAEYYAKAPPQARKHMRNPDQLRGMQPLGGR